jgi:hypothetical protein
VFALGRGQALVDVRQQAHEPRAISFDVAPVRGVPSLFGMGEKHGDALREPGSLTVLIDQRAELDARALARGDLNAGIALPASSCAKLTGRAVSFAMR